MRQRRANVLHGHQSAHLSGARTQAWRRHEDLLLSEALRRGLCGLRLRAVYTIYMQYTTSPGPRVSVSLCLKRPGSVCPFAARTV